MSAMADNEHTESLYDVIIVGSGMAGLYTALELKRWSPKLRVLVLEKYKATGGRVSTFREGGLQWESGAGRISKAHTKLLALLRRYKLTFLPISKDVLYKGSAVAPLEPDLFEAGLPAFLDPLYSLPKEELAEHTIKQLLEKVHGPKRTADYLIRYPYRTELETMRADLALDFFRAELGTQEGYGICAEGLDRVVEGMREELESLGCEIRNHVEAVGVVRPKVPKGKAAPLELSVRLGPPKEGTGRPDAILKAQELVFAVESDALGSMEGVLSRWRGLRHLKMTPLLRIYGVFPKDGQQGGLWLESAAAGGGKRIVSANPIRYLIPGRLDKGVVQISYTDSQDAEYWKAIIDEKGEAAAGLAVVEELRRLLGPSIPSPTLTKTHFWRHGVTNWIPGAYSPAEMSREALHPFPETHPGLHFCGESYSLRQGWIEGALDHAEALLPLLKRRLKKGGPK